MEKVIVTGVNGFMGNHLVNELREQGYGVIGVGREEQMNPDLADRIESYYNCDLADYEQVKGLPLTQAKAIINLAGLAAVGPSFDNPELYMRINTAVVDMVCKAAIEQDANSLRILSISSGAVYGSGQPLPLTEESKLNPNSSPYAASKIAMEELSLKYRDEGKILFVKDYSYPHDEWLWQFPEGDIEDGEDPQSAAVRELQEEAQLQASNMEKVGLNYDHHRRTARKDHIFRATGVSKASEAKGDEEEMGISTAWFTADEINQMIMDGQIVQKNTLAAWPLFLLKTDRIKGQ